MLNLQFDDYEEEIRAHLSGMLPKQLFDFGRDVESITVNRWAHGYTVAGARGLRKDGASALWTHHDRQLRLGSGRRHEDRHRHGLESRERTGLEWGPNGAPWTSPPCET